METYEVRLSEPAEAELDAILLRQARFSTQSADRLLEGLLAAFRSLSQMPKRCPLAPENDLFSHEVRQLIYRQGRTAYRILFSVSDILDDEPTSVHILRIRHSSQQMLDQPPDYDEGPS